MLGEGQLAVVDLVSYGFEVLFEARWIYREPGNPRARVDPGWRLVESPRGLDRCSQAAGDAVDVPAEVLHDPDVVALAAEGWNAGAIGNRTGSVVGLTNVFARDMSPAVWVAITDVLDALHPGLATVGYEHGAGLQAALDAGFHDIGPLRVWLARCL